MTEQPDPFERQVREAVNSDEAKELARLVLIAIDMLVNYYQRRNLAIGISFHRHTMPDTPGSISIDFDWAKLRN
jgi:hypothetical protein